MVVFSSYAMQVIMSFLMLAMIFMMLPRAQVSAKRICEVLDEEETIKDGKFNDKTKEKENLINNLEKFNDEAQILMTKQESRSLKHVKK